MNGVITDLYHSDRLFYRAVEPEKDEALFIAIQTDSISYQYSNARLATAQGSSDARKYMKSVAEEYLLGVVICLKPTEKKKRKSSIDHGKTLLDEEEEGLAIGTLHIDKASLSHHRHSSIGIDIVDKFQGQGYGGEAILWATNWAFNTAGLHRLQLRCFEYNTRALHLYQKLGFTQEGRWREFIWQNGRFWDDIQFSMLDREWFERQNGKTAVTST